MKLSEDNIELIHKHKSKFVSFKYLGDDGFLKQIDVSTSSLVGTNILFTVNNLNLHPIKSKAFIDPFRSLLTTSFYCENHSSTVNPRKAAEKIYNSATYPSFNEYFAQISFWIVDEFSEEKSSNLAYIADPIDQQSNLRADIIATLESIGIETTYHYHGRKNNESVIGIKGKTVIDLADNIIITKFVIANVAASYSRTINFTFNDTINLSLLVKSQKTQIDAIYSALTSRSKQVSTFSTQLDEYFFELKEVRHYKVNDEVVLYIGLIVFEQFIPYLCLVDLLSYEIKQKLTDKELSLVLNKKSKVTKVND
ncbi:MAG: glutamine synthetase [Rickettsiaceae bacterium]|nr:glutamine synthetase [Rickettsiaceae bacterium]